MAKLYFKYGAMGSSKTAQALITKYNYEENDMSVWLIKPSADTRDGAQVLRSRIGLEALVDVIPPEVDIYARFLGKRIRKCDVIIVDECQFLTEKQIDQLRMIVDECNIPVIAYGLRADFQGNFFEGSQWLMAWADTIEEVKTICWCGKKATFNARFDKDGNVLKEGEQVVLGANDKYIGLCRKHWMMGDLGADFRRRLLGE